MRAHQNVALVSRCTNIIDRSAAFLMRLRQIFKFDVITFVKEWKETSRTKCVGIHHRSRQRFRQFWWICARNEWTKKSWKKKRKEEIRLVKFEILSGDSWISFRCISTYFYFNLTRIYWKKRRSLKLIINSQKWIFDFTKTYTFPTYLNSFVFFAEIYVLSEKKRDTLTLWNLQGRDAKEKILNDKWIKTETQWGEQ